MKSFIYVAIICIVAVLGIFLVTKNKTEAPIETTPSFPVVEQVPIATEQNPETFIGSYENYKTDCFFDGTCAAIIDGKEVITITGWSQQISGTFENPDLDFGTKLEVYANKIDDTTYTLYGSEDYYIKEIKN